MSCKNCYPSPCSCNRQPYYTQPPITSECHDDPTVINQFLLGLQFQSDWNIPACGYSAVLSIPGVVSIPLGANIWSKTYGYYEIISYDQVKETLTIRNNCLAGNAIAGTSVPRNISFAITPTPLSGSLTGGANGSSYPYLAIDFTAPAIGQCIPVTFTTTQGLPVGKNITIGSGTYTVSAITSGTNATICNNGLGITPGTSVIANGGDGNPVYPIVLIDQNPCTSAGVSHGKLIVCSNQIAQPLNGSVIGSVATVVDTAGNVELRIPDFAGPGGLFAQNITDLQNSIATTNQNVVNLNTYVQPCVLATAMGTAYAYTANTTETVSTGAVLNQSTAPTTTSYGTVNYVSIANTSTCRNMRVTFDVDITFDWKLTGIGIVAGSGSANTTTIIAELEATLTHFEGTTLGTIASPPADPTMTGTIWQRPISLIKFDSDPDYPTLGSYHYHRRNVFDLGPGQLIKVATRGGLNAAVTQGNYTITPAFQTRQNFSGIAL